MEQLNENGKLVCMMAATMASGIMSNVTYNKQPLDAERMLKMAHEMVGMAMSVENLRAE